MGYSMYLRRDADRTLFDLGRDTWTWDAFLGTEADPQIVHVEDVSTLADLIAEHMPEWAESAISPPGFMSEYRTFVAEQVIAFCAGEPIYVVGEHEAMDLIHDRGWRVAGSRYRDDIVTKVKDNPR